MIPAKVLPVIGLETHVQLATKTKLFCRCLNRFGDPPNSNTCPVCLGLPGALPVLNRSAVELAMRVGLALGGQIPKMTKWDRKSYHYPDLPKNYQISQYDLPLCVGGKVEICVNQGDLKKIRIIRAHLEEDAGKNIHDNPSHTTVDLNRTGIPLLEIVTEPDLNTTEEVLALARELQRIVKWVDASHANMEMGQMRFEPNINLQIEGVNGLHRTPIVEVKNLNSFRSLKSTVDYEIERQYDEWQNDPEGFSLACLGKQNRGFDTVKGITVFQREKEEAHDYRYFPEPDLVPLRVAESWRRRVVESLGEQPGQRRKRYKKDYGFTKLEIDSLTQERKVGELLDQAAELGASPRRCAHILMGVAASAANQRGSSLGNLNMQPPHLADLANLLEEKKIVSTSASRIVEIMLKTQKQPSRIAEEESLLVQTDIGAVEKWVEEAMEENPKAVQDARTESKAIGFLIGQVMKKSQGTAPPQEVRRILTEKIS